MCGIAGCLDLRGAGRIERSVVAAMTETLVHRGPDSSGLYIEPNVALGIRRLEIIDLETGDQPITNEDGTVILVCNGEIFNYRELRAELTGRGHRFRTRTDVEVLVHLYEEHGAALVDHLNGQFAFTLYDRREERLLLARDPFGVNPLYVCESGGLLLFASEIKGILRHPAAPRRIDLVGLDQILSLPGLVSPRTLLAGIRSLPPGHLLVAARGEATTRQYWDLEYPLEGEALPVRSEEEWVEELRERFERSVERRLQADVPVGLFLSGGMDSSLVSAAAVRLSNGSPRHSFSIAFDDDEIDEGRYQRLMARHLGSEHHEIRFGSDAMIERLHAMVLHGECPVKETFNTCSLALAAAAHEAGVPVVLGGEGADEIFGGYPGYRFDSLGERNEDPLDVETALEEELRERVWGDRRIFYEKNQVAFREVKAALYSPALRERMEEFDCMSHPLVDRERLRGRHPLHQRSYLDLKLRLADHLLGEHGDRMVMAHSVEGRYPFLDLEIVDLARRMPPDLKVRDLTAKYVVRRMAEGTIPRQIVAREKFGFRAPGSPLLLQRRVPWVEDLLSVERVRRQGFFDAGLVERLKARYAQPGFRLHPHLDTDLLLIVLTFNMFLETFEVSDPG
jgi:asparagine synthase (glutamine-hydrolysing)